MEPVASNEAREAAQRLIDFAFGNTAERPRFSIPARPDRDDDLIVCRYIEESQIEITTLRDELAEAVRTIDRLTKERDARPASGSTSHRFRNVYCSACGGDFGPGDEGFSHCVDHIEQTSRAAEHASTRRDEARAEVAKGGGQ